MSRIDLVIFDMDGTIFDTEKLGIECWKEAFEKMNIPVPEKVLYNKIGLNSKDSKELMKKESGVDFDYDVRAYESYLEKQGDELTQDEKHKLFHLKMVLWVYHTKVLEGGYDKPIHCLYTRIGDYPGVVSAKLIYYYNPITEADDPDYEYVVKGIGISSPFLLFFYRLPKSEATTG